MLHDEHRQLADIMWHPGSMQPGGERCLDDHDGTSNNQQQRPTSTRRMHGAASTVAVQHGRGAHGKWSRRHMTEHHHGS